MLFAIGTAFLWAILPFALVPIFARLDVPSVIGFRFAFSFVILFLWLGFKNNWKLKKIFAWSPMVLAAGALLALNYFGFSHGLSLTTASTAQILIQTGPLIFTLIGLFVFREKLNPVQIFGMALASVGFLLFYEEQLSNLLEGAQSFNLGVFWVFVGGLTWGVYAVFHKLAAKKYAPQTINMSIYALATLLYLPFVKVQEFEKADSLLWALLIFSGFNTVFAYGFLSEALKRTSATKVSLIICLNPILTMIISEVASQLDLHGIRHDNLKSMAWMGAICVVVGAIFVVSGKPKIAKDIATKISE